MEPQSLFIPVILGTARNDRQSEKPAKFVFSQARQYGFSTQLLDVRQFGLSRTDNTDTTEVEHKYRAFVAKSDGFIIVAPEYNHGYPGELKLALDQAYKEYNRKPVAICGVSAGSLGGPRMVEQLRLVAIELQLVPIRNAVYFSNVRDLFDERGAPKDPAPFEKRLRVIFDELAWYAAALKTARAGI